MHNSCITTAYINEQTHAAKHKYRRIVDLRYIINHNSAGANVVEKELTGKTLIE